jgi:hypothetical protein
MSLTNFQIEDLAKRMGTPLERICFKDDLIDEPLVYNKGYIVNLSDSVFQDGKPAEGTHYVAFFVKKSGNGKVEPISFDSYGVAPCKEIMDYINGGKTPPYNKIDIQSIVGEQCGWYCLAFLYYISSYPNRCHSLYDDAEHFCDLFNDLNKSSDWKYNEYILKTFFRSSNKAERDANPIGVFNDAKKNSQFNHAKGIADIATINSKV